MLKGERTSPHQVPRQTMGQQEDDAMSVTNISSEAFHLFHQRVADEEAEWMEMVLTYPGISSSLAYLSARTTSSVSNSEWHQTRTSGGGGVTPQGLSGPSIPFPQEPLGAFILYSLCCLSVWLSCWLVGLFLCVVNWSVFAVSLSIKRNRGS